MCILPDGNSVIEVTKENSAWLSRASAADAPWSLQRTCRTMSAQNQSETDGQLEISGKSDFILHCLKCNYLKREGWW